jgi:hypothetical protein
MLDRDLKRTRQNLAVIHFSPPREKNQASDALLAPFLDVIILPHPNGFSKRVSLTFGINQGIFAKLCFGD